MRTRRLLLVPLLLALGLPALTAGPAPADPVVPTLVGIRASHHPGYDRVVFDFTGGPPASRRVGYVDQLVGDGSGEPVPVAGQAVLQVRLFPAKAHDPGGQTAPGRRAFALPNVMTVVRGGDFESVTTYGIGLERKTAFRVSTLRKPDRLVVDVNAGFRTIPRKVYLFDRTRYLDNRPPFFTAVTRRVQPASPARGVLDRLFAGPVPAESGRGLRLLRSGADDFAGLSIGAGGVARVRLVGGCASGGSTVTIAGEIMPTLRQFASVDRVKIFAPDGTTERPTGHTDSIPECLEP